MAEILDTYTFPGQGRPRTYPWHTWADGQSRRLRRHVDFDILPTTIRSLAHRYAARNNLTVVTSLEGEDVIVLQFAPRVVVKGKRRR